MHASRFGTLIGPLWTFVDLSPLWRGTAIGRVGLLALVGVIARIIQRFAITAITGEIAFSPSIIAISSYYLRSRAIIRAIIAITEGENAISPVIAVIANL